MALWNTFKVFHKVKADIATSRRYNTKDEQTQALQHLNNEH